MACLYAQGTVITIEDGVGTPITIGGVTSFSFGDGEAADIDVTTLSSTAKEYCIGLQDQGDLTMEIVRDFSDAGQQEFDAAKIAQDTRAFLVTFSDGSTAAFSANPKAFNIDGQSDEVIRSTATAKVTGDVTYTPAP